jgi:hypothetical protein
MPADARKAGVMSNPSDRIYVIFRRDYTPPGKEEPLYFRGTYHTLTRQAFNVLSGLGCCDRADEPTMEVEGNG